MINQNTPIVIVAYNRPRSLKRLLSSIKKANFPNKNINLIISIDKAVNNQEVLDVANNFNWEYGIKKVIYQEKNLGLRAHIIKCGNLSYDYGSVLVLEDDLYVAPNFYEYTTQALTFSNDKKYIGGISLYNHQFNVNTEDNFSPIEDDYDNWYLQFASSWGQAWTLNQWSGFMDWYNSSPEIKTNNSIPDFVKSWSEKSWLKYNISYLIEKNLFFLYPRVSMTTNFSDAGTHIGHDSTIFQVPLDYSKKSIYHFSKINETTSLYDAFFENLLLFSHLNLNQEDITVDLYGSKLIGNKRFLLSSKILNFKIVQSFGKSLKPIDANIIEMIEGNDFFLYDIYVNEKNTHTTNRLRNVLYNIKILNHADAFLVVKKEMKRKLNKAIDKIFRTK